MYLDAGLTKVLADKAKGLKSNRNNVRREMVKMYPLQDAKP
jgi:hypothetical protein